MVSPSGTRPTQTYFSTFPNTMLRRRYDQKTRAYQKAPFNLVLPYSRSVGSLDTAPLIGAVPSNQYYGSPPTYADSMPGFGYVTNSMTLVSNKAYDTFKGSVYANAQLGVDFIEYRQSLSMMTRSATTLIKALVQVKKLDFWGAAVTLKMHFVPPKVSVRKSWSDNWLEYHFGWEPLVRDIYDSVEVLNNPIKSFSHSKGVGRSSEMFTYLEDLGSVYRRVYYRTQYICRQGGYVQAITDRGLHSLDQFGVLNPAAIAWELVPFSFVIDWYANVGQVLSSFSDFAGMSLGGVYTSTLFRTQMWGLCYPKPGFSSPSMTNLNFWGGGSRVTRVGSLTSPAFAVKSVRLPSKVRAATAISLLIQQLSSR